jgi:hypothetical protein
MDPQMIPDNRTYSVKEIRCKRFNLYYRVLADGRELSSTVYIMPSQKTARVIEQLEKWCKQNSHRLADGEVVRADLDEVDSEVPGVRVCAPAADASPTKCFAGVSTSKAEPTITNKSTPHSRCPRSLAL